MSVKSKQGSGLARRKVPAKQAAATRRKNFLLPQAKIDRARKILGAATDTETIIQALDAVVDLAAFRDETDAALARLVGQGQIVNYFDPPPLRSGSAPRKRTRSSGRTNST